MIKFTAIVSVVAVAAFARKTAHQKQITTRPRAVLQKKLAVRPRRMWTAGDAKPSPPSPEECYSIEAFFYTDESGCWWEWDEYCLPNWDNDEECLAVTLDFVDSLGQSAGTDATCNVPPPEEACFYEDAYLYRDDSTCETSWREWDR